MAGVAHRVQKAGNLLSVFFTGSSEPVTDYETVKATETFRFARSSTRCSTRESIRRRARSRRGSCPRPSTTTRFQHRRRTAGRRRSRRGHRPQGNQSMHTVVHMMRHGEGTTPTVSCTAGCPVSGCPTPAAPRPARSRPRSPTTTSPPCSPHRCSGAGDRCTDCSGARSDDHHQ